VGSVGGRGERGRKKERQKRTLSLSLANEGFLEKKMRDCYGGDQEKIIADESK